MSDPLAELSAAGVAIWLDDMSRNRLVSGNFAELIRDKHIVGATTNPSIFQKALSQGAAYDAQLGELARPGSGRGRGRARDHHHRRAQRVRRHQARVPVLRWDRRADLDRGRPAAGARRAGHRRRGARALAAGRPAEHVREDPGARRGHPRHPALPSRGHLDQRHAHLRARSLPAGHGGVSLGPRGAVGRRQLAGGDRERGVVLRLARGHRVRPPPRPAREGVR